MKRLPKTASALPLHDQVEELGILLRAVLEVGVLDHDHVARRLGDSPPHRRALAPVLLLQQQLEAARAGELGEPLARAVARGVVDGDELDAQRHRQDAAHDLVDRRALVVDRHHDAQDRIRERRTPLHARVGAAHRRPMPS